MDEVPQKDAQLFLSLLGKHYDRVQEVTDFGQNCTTLQVMKRRTTSGEKSP